MNFHIAKCISYSPELIVNAEDRRRTVPSRFSGLNGEEGRLLCLLLLLREEFRLWIMAHAEAE